MVNQPLIRPYYCGHVSEVFLGIRGFYKMLQGIIGIPGQTNVPLTTTNTSLSPKQPWRCMDLKSCFVL